MNGKLFSYMSYAYSDNYNIGIPIGWIGFSIMDVLLQAALNEKRLYHRVYNLVLVCEIPQEWRAENPSLEKLCAGFKGDGPARSKYIEDVMITNYVIERLTDNNGPIFKQIEDRYY